MDGTELSTLKKKIAELQEENRELRKLVMALRKARTRYMKASV